MPLVIDRGAIDHCDGAHRDLQDIGFRGPGSHHLRILSGVHHFFGLLQP